MQIVQFISQFEENIILHLSLSKECTEYYQFLFNYKSLKRTMKIEI